ncbi:Arylsulfatase A [Polaribacter sp. KT25b]|uniref:sulfatase n=1 Tax=Polaribacter sp. KT25b TaxID=1855336 RepID=UPI00087CCA59|nr:sulfatase [Polaribacter sp. KT25b]SDR75827.1 Arylsulfatase A [Polaribacter sp. KT25b]
MYSNKLVRKYKLSITCILFVIITINVSCRTTVLSTVTNIETEESKPNILFILTDDAGYHDYGFQGSKDFKTPQIDRLAASGIFCTNGYVSASVCGPSRAGILTGRYQQRFGFFMNPNDSQNLPKDETTIADALKENGYKTGIIGKWHMGFEENFHPNDRGFDYFYGFLSGNRSYFPLPKKMNKKRRYKDNLRHNDSILPEASMDFYTTDLFTDKAMEFMADSQKSKKPFFLYLSYNAIHGPLNALPEDIAVYKDLKDPVRRITGGMTASLDRSFGKLLDYLETNGLRENTLVVWVNDNGGQGKKMHTNNWPLKGFKGAETEGGIRVPFLLSMPNILPENKRYDLPVISLDLMPTFIKLAGGNPSANPKPLNGVNLMPYLKGENTNSPHEILFWQRNDAAVRKGDWKLIDYVTKNELHLYNLKKDIGEKINLIDKYPEIAKELKKELSKWQNQNAPRMK